MTLVARLLRAAARWLGRLADRIDPPIPCSDSGDEYGCPWDDHEHDPADFHVVDGEWRRRLSVADRLRRPHHPVPTLEQVDQWMREHLTAAAYQEWCQRS